MRRNTRPRRIAVLSNKGGVGKSTEARELACALARASWTVDLVDLAPQGNLTRRTGVDRQALIAAGHPDLAALLDPSARNTLKYGDILVPVGWDTPWSDKIRLAPSLNAFEMRDRANEAARPGADHRLCMALDGQDDDRHVVIIDADPSMDHLCTMAVAAADAVVICVEPDYDAVEGGVNTVANIQHLKRALNRPELFVAGVAITRVQEAGRIDPTRPDALSTLSAGVRAQIANLPTAFADVGGESVIWDTLVPWYETVRSSQSDALPLEAYPHPAARRAEKVFAAHAASLVKALGYN